MTTSKSAKRLGSIFFLCAILASVFHSFLSDNRLLRSLSQDDVIVDINSISTAADLELESTTVDSCYRQCPQGRINRIFYTGSPGGFNDKRYIIRDLAELAGYLCAKVVLPTPRQLLHEKHNNGEKLSPYIQWGSVYDVRFAEDNESVVIQDQCDVNVGYEGYLRVVSYGLSWRDGFEKVQEHSWKQDHAWRRGDHTIRGFLWELRDTDPYHNDLTSKDLPMLKENLRNMVGHHYNPVVMKPQVRLNRNDAKPIGCQYANDIKDAVPGLVLMMRKKLAQRIKKLSENSTIGALHLRRGDAINECDTSIAAVKEYLSCSLRDTEEKGYLTIWLASDERDDKYRQTIMELVNGYDHVTMVDLDKLTRQVIEEAIQKGELDSIFQNNYFEFEVQSGMKLFEFTLVRRRVMQCRDCTKLSKLLK